MEPPLDKEKSPRPSYLCSIEPERTGLVDVSDIKVDLSADFSLASSSSDTSLRNSLESKGHIEVCLRVRPFTSLERENELQGCVSLQDSTSIILHPPKTSLSQLSEKTAGQMIQKFTFSQVFGPETSQEEFFEATMKQPVQDFLNGFNNLIFTYGTTNAGKTYTFQGRDDDVGILPRAMDMLFKNMQGKIYTAMDVKPHRCRDYMKLTKDQVREEIVTKNSILRPPKEVDYQNSTNSKAPADSNDLEELLNGLEEPSTTVKNYTKFSVWVSFFEIYNECFYDLLIPVSNDKKRKTLRLAQDIKGCSYVKDLQWIQISDSKEAIRLLKLGLKRQSIASTKLNACSSRSHSIFTVKILRIEDLGTPRVTHVNELVVCDLAGSERCTKTHNEGDRLKESGNINTSLLTLGKCINGLKNYQQSKLQQHIPFRESKLTHFLQGFFSGKGKVYMIVNISQCASTYDETLNVLKFSAIAQKVLVMDTSVLPQDHSFDQKSAKNSSLLNYTKMPIPRKRATILWDRTLEDVFEDDGDETEEQDNRSREEAVEKQEESEILIGKEKYMALLSLIEMLKSKLIDEKKSKLLLELKIREEVTQEFTKYFAEQERDFKESLSWERERLEENSEIRLEIFKELINGSTKSVDKERDLPCSEQVRPLNEDTHINLEGIIDTLQDDVIDIKKKAEEAQRFIVSLENQQEATGWLEKHLGKITAELTQTKEELAKKTNELIKTQEELTQKTKDVEMQMTKMNESAEQLKEATKKMNTQNERIQELMDIVEEKDDAIVRLQDLISHLEKTIKDYDNTVTTIKRQLTKKDPNEVIESQLRDCEETVLNVRRKRCLEDKSTVEDQPAKKGNTKENWENNSLEQKRTEYMRTNSSENYAEIALKEKTETLEGHLAALEEQCRREKAEKEQLSGQIMSLHLKLSTSEERASGLSEELQQCRADYQMIVSELDKQKTINREQEERIIHLNNEIKGAKQNIIDEVPKVKTMQSKVDKLSRCHIESCAVDIDSLDSQKDEPERVHMSPVCVQSQTTENLTQEYLDCSVESVREEHENISKTSSQKSQLIQELFQQVEDLKKRLDDTENYNNQLKIKFSEVQNQSIKEKDLIDQLQEQIQKKTQDFEKQAAEDHRVIAQLEEEVASYRVKTRKLESFHESFKDDSATELEEVFRKDEYTILDPESNLVSLQKKCTTSDKMLEKNEDEQTQSVELIHKDLSASYALLESLKKELQRKGENADLKEKSSDAKKLIQQVQREENEAKYQADRKKWLEEKMRLQNQVKETENRCNREIKKYAEDRECHVQQQQEEIERLAAQLVEKDNNLQKWREERDKLVEALEVQLKTLASTTIQKDKEIAELKQAQATLKDSGKGKETQIEELRKQLAERDEFIKELEQRINHRSPQSLAEVPSPEEGQDKIDQSVNKEGKETQIEELRKQLAERDEFIKELEQRINRRSPQSLAEVPSPEEGQDKIDQSVNKKDHSETALYSSEASTENGKTSMSPKPDLEVQFTPLQPNKSEVMHQGNASSFTVKTLKPRRKRKSEEMDEDFVESKNKKNAKPAMTDSSTSNKKKKPTTDPFRKEYLLRKQQSTSSKSSTKKKDGTLKKIGDFIQSSPNIFHSKAKKLIMTISSPKSTEPENVKEKELKPKRAKRKLYTADSSGPLDISPSLSFPEQKEKESDHLIMKRQLRSKLAK